MESGLLLVPLTWEVVTIDQAQHRHHPPTVGYFFPYPLMSFASLIAWEVVVIDQGQHHHHTSCQNWLLLTH